MNKFLTQFKAARRVSTPIVCIRTADPVSTIREIIPTLVKDSENREPAVLLWDACNGLTGVNQRGQEEQAAILRRSQDAKSLQATVPGVLQIMHESQPVAEDSIIFLSNVHRFLGDPVGVQAVFNTRERFKERGCMVVLLTTPGALLPEELVQDTLILDEPLPTEEQLQDIIKKVYSDADVEIDWDKKENAELLIKGTDSLIGLPEFPAEQTTSMELSNGKLDINGMWERKKKIIEQTPGLAVWRGGEMFNDIGGCENVKKFMRALIDGQEPPRVIVFMDEIEKAFAGTGTELSGVKTEMTGTLLTWMQDKEADGTIFIGPPGAAKSVTAKAIGNEASIPTIAFDLSAMQGSLVGQSGERLRAALKIVEATAEGHALFVATCNSIGSLPPELRRRFTLGTFFFDLPTAEERDDIWKIYEKKYKVKGKRPDDHQWTGSEIKQCCKNAWKLNLSLVDSASFIVPVAVSAQDKIQKLRAEATGKFIGASAPGIYKPQPESINPSGRRKVRPEDEAVLVQSKGEA